MYVYPQLPDQEAFSTLADLAHCSIKELTERASSSAGSAEFYPVGGARTPDQKLTEVRTTILAIAKEHNFPHPPSGRGSAFDSAVATQIVDLMQIVPSDAMEQSVWSFLTLRVLPDVAAWRYPFRMTADGQIDSSYERIIGRPRNVFRKLWMRAFIFGPELGPRLGEDNWEGFYGRPSIGGNPHLARMIATEFFRRADLARSLGRSVQYQDSLRDALKRILRMSGLVSLHAMPDDAVLELISQAFEETSLGNLDMAASVGATL